MKLFMKPLHRDPSSSGGRGGGGRPPLSSGSPSSSSAFMKPSMKLPEPSEGEDGGERGDGAPRSPPRRSSGSSSLGSWEAPREEALLGLTSSGASRAPQAPLFGEPPPRRPRPPLPPSEETEGGVGVWGSVFPVRSPRHFSRSRAPLTLSHLPRGLIELRGPLVLGGLIERVSLEGSGAIRLPLSGGFTDLTDLTGSSSERLWGLIGGSEVKEN
jgi:hypothetical protein